jgi:hypothetical protein
MPDDLFQQGPRGAAVSARQFQYPYALLVVLPGDGLLRSAAAFHALFSIHIAGKNIRTRVKKIAETIRQFPAYHFFHLTSTGLTKTFGKKLSSHSLFSKILVPFCGM